MHSLGVAVMNILVDFDPQKKMAACSKSEGYRCEFIDSVIELFYCKKCNLVARRLTLTSCCGESYCHACIANIHQQGKPCPECGEGNFNIYEQLKYQKLIGALRAYCSMKERGCGWSGSLEQLDTHLDPDQDNCQYVDTRCPLNCHMTIPKNKVGQHVAQECTKRPHVCQHCGFKATYEEVVDIHLPECKYVPLQCPNRCGVTCERGDMEDHMKMCRLEEIVCKFEGMGCSTKLPREDYEEHAVQSIQEHLELTAVETVKTKQELQQKLQEQEQKLQEQETKLQEQEQKLQEQETKLQEQETKLQEQETKLQEQEQKLQEQDEKNGVQEQKLRDQDALLKHLMEHFIKSTQSFEVRNVTKKKKESFEETSPSMYSHINGYKFCVEIKISALHQDITATLYAMQGEFDKDLKWPVEATFTLTLLNQRGGEDAECTVFKIKWNRPGGGNMCLTSFSRRWGTSYYFLDSYYSKIDNFLFIDTLYFHVKVVNIR